MKSISTIFLLCALLAQTQAQTESADTLASTHTRITMRDSMQVAVTLFGADSTRPKATILIRTPNSSAEYATEISHFLGTQFCVVVQNTRRLSPVRSADSALTSEAGWMHPTDGYDTVEWIAAQPWCNGKVGTFGRGLSGFTQILLAGSAPPQLAAQYLIAIPYNFHDELIFPGGAFRKTLAEKIPFPTVAGDSLRVYEKHYAYGFFWEAFNGIRHARDVNVPIAFVTGWYDAYAKGTIRAFQATQRFAGSAAKASARLRIGPWTDNQDGFGKRRQGELTFPQNAEFDILHDAVRWFDQWLNSTAGDSIGAPAVQYYLMSAVEVPDSAGNRWQQASNWPPAHDIVEYYLKKNGELGVEIDEKDTAEGYRYNPAAPVPTTGGANLHLEAGPMDQQNVERRSDVLLFTSQPLAAPVAIAGKITARLFVASSAYDTDFTAKLSDVYPDGRSMLITDGILRMRMRDSQRYPKLMAPNKVYEIEVELGHTAYLFKSGHRIRLAISSSNSPRFEPNPNSPFDFHQHKRLHVAVNSIYYGGDKPSSVRLPVLSQMP